MDHADVQPNEHGPAVTSRHAKTPLGWWADPEAHKVVGVQRGNEAVGVGPNANPLEEDVPIDGKFGVKVRAQHTIILRADEPQIEIHADHSSAAIGQQDGPLLGNAADVFNPFEAS